VAAPPAIASDILIGRAVLPATTFAPGPTSGQQLGSAPINGQAVPFVDKQPVQGFSAVADNGDGSFMVMADNGFGAMENSSDFNLRVYRIRPDFKTTQGGSGTIQVETSIELHDPDKKIPFTIANHFSAERVLTGADLDIESLQVAPDDTPVQANRMTTSSSLSSWISRWPTAGIAVPEAGSSKDHLAVTKW